MQLQYRADIDGLRAVAVLSVVGFHAFPFWIVGGFIGVDVFFVISGFLISTILFNGLEDRNFSFFSFYSHRIKRIFPALLVVLTSVYVFGWVALYPNELQQIGKHIAASAGFVSNIVFWRESGYFDTASETKPLLHLWSLGIEEQFYILWPLLLWLSPKRNFNLLFLTIAIGGISFALNVIEINYNTATAFYSPQARFWELSIGSILAYLMLCKPRSYAATSDWGINTLSFLGIALILISIVLVNKDRAFPGWWAALPTIGSALIIFAGPRAWLNRVILSHKALVWIGQISYPLYLWHWPLLSFANIIGVEYPSRTVRILLIFTAMVLAWLTQALIEKPIRYGRNSKIKVIAMVGLMFVVGVVGYETYQYDGFKFRQGSNSIYEYSGDIGSVQFFNSMKIHYDLCEPMMIQQEATRWNDGTDNIPRCFQSKRREPVTVAIIGDSEAESLFLGLAGKLPEENVAYYIGSNSASVLNNPNSRTFKYIIENRSITTVIILMYWQRYQKDHPNLSAELSETVSKLTAAKKRVYLLDGVPSFRFDAINCKYERPNGIGRKRTCIQDRQEFDLRYKEYYPILAMVAKNTKAEIINTAKNFCNTDYCSMEKDGHLLYRDKMHLNILGSQYLADKIIGSIKKQRFE